MWYPRQDHVTMTCDHWYPAKRLDFTLTSYITTPHSQSWSLR
jgi:hypothetical protein